MKIHHLPLCCLTLTAMRYISFLVFPSVNTMASFQRLNRRNADYCSACAVPALCEYHGETVAPELPRVGVKSRRDLPLSLRVVPTSLQDACFWRRKSHAISNLVVLEDPRLASERDCQA
jgi:hypothetical protein